MNPFQSISGRMPQSSQFDLTHQRKFSFRPGFLYPIMCQEALPSDAWQYDANALVRMQPMLAPLMHQVDVCVHSFFYPARLTMQRGKFETFITGGKNGDGKDAQGNTIVPPFFKVTGTGSSGPLHFVIDEHMGIRSLADYLGIQWPDEAFMSDREQDIDARPFIAFWRIYCEYFRDQNLSQDWVEVYPDIFDSPGGNITEAIWAALTNPNPALEFNFFGLPAVCWEKDYFTSALPFAQRGEAVETPIQGSATVRYKDTTDFWPNTASNPPVAGDGYAVGGDVELIPTNVNNPAFMRPKAPADPFASVRVENIDEIDVTTGGFTITALRTAARLQEWLEKMATGGARYIEQIKAQFGVTSSDARLQRAEYLGGGKIPMHVSEVLQTGADDGTPLAEMAGHGVTAGQVTAFRKFCEEHGYFISFIYMRPKTAYQSGLPRMFWNRFDKLDYAWPSFARIGEQEILRKELFFACDSSDDDIFGYQQRYAEYKYIPSTVHGDFRSTLDFWHWGRIFDTAPGLNETFVRCTPSDRIFNVLSPSTDTLYAIVTNRITARRPLPYYGEPYL